ncbi:MAG: hypothetical protein AB1942_24940 [Pseudomonadota bacterium]
MDDPNLPSSPSDGPEDAWVQSSTGDAAIRIRNLSVYLRNGGALKEVRLLEGEDRRYTMWVRLANRGGEFRVNLFRSDQPKTYKDLDLAMATIRDDFGFFGAVSVATDRPAVAGRAQAGTLGDDEG